METDNQPTTRNHLLGAAEIAGGVVLLAAPVAFMAVAAGGFCYLTYKKYQENAKLEETKQKSFASQVLGAAAMAFGTVVSSYTGIGAAIMVGVGLVQGAMGNAASFDMVHGAILGTAVSVGLPVLAGAMILEGSYKAITGKDCDIVRSTATYISKGIKRVTDYVISTPDKEAVKEATVNLSNEAKDVAGKAADRVTKDIGKHLAKDPSLLAKLGEYIGNITNHNSGKHVRADATGESGPAKKRAKSWF